MAQHDQLDVLDLRATTAAHNRAEQSSNGEIDQLEEDATDARSARREKARPELWHPSVKRERPGKPGPLVECGAVELCDQDALAAASGDLAAHDLRLVWDQRVELLVSNPGGDELRRLLALLRGLEETERGEDAVAGRGKCRASAASTLEPTRWDHHSCDPLAPYPSFPRPERYRKAEKLGDVWTSRGGCPLA